MANTQTTINKDDAKTLAQMIGQQVDYAALQQATVTEGYDIAEKVWEGEKFQHEKAIQEILNAGSLTDLKVAMAAALKVSAEQGKIKALPPKTSTAVFADLSSIGAESARIMNDVAERRCTPREGMERMADNSTAVLSRTWSKKGREIGGGIGSTVGSVVGGFFGPAGVVVGTLVGGAVGGFIGATVGAMAGSKVVQGIRTAVKKVATVAVETVKKVGTKIKEGVKKLGNWFKSKLKGENTSELNSTDSKEVAQMIGQQTDYAALQQATITTGYDRIEKVWGGEKFQHEATVKEALNTGNLTEMKVAMAAALKVGSEQGKISSLPPKTSTAIFADISNIGVESTRILNDVAEKRCTPREGAEKIADTATATLSRSWSEKGRALGKGIGSQIGGAIGGLFGKSKVGATIGGAIGSAVGAAVGAMAGSQVVQGVCTAVKKVATAAVEGAKKVGNAIKEGAKKLWGGIKNLFSRNKSKA